MTLNLDFSFFSVVCELKGCLYIPETDLEDMTFQRIVDDIRSGQLENVRAVLEYNPSEGWCSDVTGDVLTALCPEEDADGDPNTPHDWSDYRSERIDGRLAGVSATVAA
ncbi:hypothetical protein [Roseibium aggregatum]|uniref:Uncharacterized protein n=1 Tax=Roseibium aggregatum TaxID=187304 RepID=A0A939EI65_9HYPH|nr:hypothetical protein [Roseibium aggregatum]MBN9673474.1 hypothetical protein [Roseibium aggregatum]